jgi:two-component system phosphate regulon sensor histidine kinase PhoR
MKLTLLQKLAFRTAILSVILLSVLAAAFYLILDFRLPYLLLFILISVIFLYVVYAFQMKKFIFLQLNRVYNSNLFKNEPLLKKELEDIDFENFIDGIRNFAETKHKEIERLHNRDDFRRDFLGDVSHELKTPLFTAQGYLLTILDDAMDDPELRKKYLERTNKSIERLSYIVKDLDMIAKLESGMKLDPSSFNILKIIDEAFDLLELRANKKNILLGFKEVYNYPILVRADKEKIEQVMINLISNSIKYGKVNGSTLVRVHSISDQRVQIDVTDDGVGIDEKDIPRLFERFYRVDKSRSREQGGSGLGLSIVKHIIEAHGQEVKVSSELGSGSTFSFTLNKAK